MALRIPMGDDPEPVAPDSPTRSGAAVTAPEPAARPPRAPTNPTNRRRSTADRATQSPVPAVAADASSVHDALASAPATVTTRAPRELWALAGARAEETGLPIRLILTDALVRALEQDPVLHEERLRETRRREKLARVDAED